MLRMMLNMFNNNSTTDASYAKCVANMLKKFGMSLKVQDIGRLQ